MLFNQKEKRTKLNDMTMKMEHKYMECHMVQVYLTKKKKQQRLDFVML